MARPTRYEVLDGRGGRFPAVRGEGWKKDEGSYAVPAASAARRLSRLGVTIAATVKMITTAQRNCFMRKRGVTTPRSERRKRTTGSSNISPSPRMIVIRKPK